jgi:hypothetical protein
MVLLASVRSRVFTRVALSFHPTVLDCLLPRVLLSIQRSLIIPASLPRVPERIGSIPGRLPIILLGILPQVGGLLAILLGFLHMAGSSILPRVEHVLLRLPEILCGVTPQVPCLILILPRVPHRQVSLSSILPRVHRAGARGLGLSWLLSIRDRGNARHQQGHEGGGMSSKHVLPPSKRRPVDADCRRQGGKKSNIHAVR